MKKFKEYLSEFMNGNQIPLLRRKGVNGSNIFCPNCGKTFVYYKLKTQCRYCGADIVSDPNVKPLDNVLNVDN